MKTAVTFGELMIRLNPPGYLRFTQAHSYEATYGGGEANVAVMLANLGADARYVTKLPDNDLGKAGIMELRRYGVDVSQIAVGGERVGIYFAEKGASQRPSKVIYDRKNSSIATAKRSDFDWEKIFDGAGWFHYTGITPALSDELAAVCEDACKAAVSKGIPVSCDLNYRKNLWSSEKAGQVMAKLMPYASLCIANEEDAEKVFGIKAEGSDVSKGKLDRSGFTDVAKKISGRFGCKQVAITLRGSVSASDNTWAGLLYESGKEYFSREYAVHIVDRVGGGDSFGAGLIYALMNDYARQDAIEFAVAGSCLKHSVEYDFNQVTLAEVKALVGGDGSGRVQR